MSIAIYCLIFAALMILITKIPVAIAMKNEKGGYDNHLPRDQQARLEGLGKRAVAAHQNALEAFPLFATGIILAWQAEADETNVTYLALAFVAARIVYTLAYWKDIATLRSTAWSVGFIASIWLMVLAIP